MRRIRFVPILLFVLATGCGDDPESPAPDPVWHKLETNPILTAGAAGTWDEAGVGAACVLARDDGSFVLWYTGFGAAGSQIGRATSADGVQWTKDAANPVLAFGAHGAWDALTVCEPCVRADAAGFRMYYTGTGSLGRKIGYATSPDGVLWTRLADPVLEPGLPGQFDDVAVYTPWVLDEGMQHTLWYGALASTGYLATGRAASPDGLHWTKQLSPVLDPMVLEALTFGPCILKRGVTYQAWYVARHETPDAHSFPGVIDFAQSRDGIDWTLNRLALSYDTAGGWDAGALRSVCVLDTSAGLRMWYEGVSPSGEHGLGYAWFGPP
jgi:predicted GH43/DUF377 family glycosyl hydrolase